jgi:hypothetical protein
MPPVPSHSGNANVAEICNQVLMMLSHEIFDPEFGERVLIDQAFIVAGGEITKQALNWARQRTSLGLSPTRAGEACFRHKKCL